MRAFHLQSSSIWIQNTSYEVFFKTNLEILVLQKNKLWQFQM